MNWEVIVASLTSSAVIAGAIGYILKKSFDQTIQNQFEKFKIQSKLQFEEQFRRTKLLYDDQYQGLKKILTLVYKIRNNYKDFMEIPETSQFTTAKSLENDFYDLENTLYMQKATLPESIFNVVHDFKNVLKFDIVTLRQESEYFRPKELIIENMADKYKKLDNLYFAASKEIQDYIGNE